MYLIPSMINLDEQDFGYLNQVKSNDLLESQRMIQRDKRLSISSIDEELYESIQIPQIHNIKSCLEEVSTNKDLVIAFILKNGSYLKSLNQTFEDLEDFEDYEGLFQIFCIIKSLIFSCDASIIELLLDQQNYNLTLGAFEYDPSNTKSQKYRQFINTKSDYQLEHFFDEDDTINNIILKNYRTQYFRDCIIAYMIDEQLSSTLNSIIYYNNQDILSYVLDYENFFPKLLEKYEMDKCTQFLDEFLNTIKTIIQQDIKIRAIAIINYHDIMSDFFEFFIESIKNSSIILQLLNIFQNIQGIDQNILVKQIIDRGQTNEFMSALIHITIKHDSGTIHTLLDWLKQLTDNGVQKKFQMVDAIYYKFLQPLMNQMENCSIEKKIGITELITEFLTYSSTKHGIQQYLGFKLRGFLMQQKILQHLWKLLDLNQKNINLSLIRFFKQIVMQNDEIMIKYIQQNQFTPPIISIFLKLKQNNNIMYSCFLELFYFIFKNNIKKMISSIFEKYYHHENKEIIWNKLKKKYESQSDFNPQELTDMEQENSKIQEILEIPRNFLNLENKDQSYLRQLACEEEESYFNEDSKPDQEEIQKVESQTLKVIQRKISFKKEEEEEVMTFHKPVQQASPSKTKTNFSFSLSLGSDTFKKVKMDNDL